MNLALAAHSRHNVPGAVKDRLYESLSDSPLETAVIECIAAPQCCHSKIVFQPVAADEALSPSQRVGLYPTRRIHRGWIRPQKPGAGARQVDRARLM